MGAQAAGGHEMSVPKSRRGESPAEYINLAREIYVFTYNRVRILPKSYTFYFSLPLYNAAREAYRLIKTANLIYIHNDADKQNRKELYERAQGYYNSMLDVLDLAYMNVNHEKLPSNVLKEWVKLITDELAQISKIKRSDKARYGAVFCPEQKQGRKHGGRYRVRNHTETGLLKGGKHMNEIILKRIGALLSVKSIVTLALTAVFAYLAVTKQISQEFMVVYTVVIAFYFGTQTQKISDAVESKGAQ